MRSALHRICANVHKCVLENVQIARKSANLPEQASAYLLEEMQTC